MKLVSDSIPKVINDNGCWIPKLKPMPDGYVRITINYKSYSLHRLVLCQKLGLPYDGNFQCRHGQFCSKACFNPEHLKTGNNYDNAMDEVLFGRNHNANKTYCKLGHLLTGKDRRAGGKVFRFCTICKNRQTRERRAKATT